MAPFLMATMATGTTMGIMGTLQEGKDVQKIAKARAAILMLNAKYEREAAAEKARIIAEEGQQLAAKQTAAYAARGIKTDVGVPLVVRAKTLADVHKDIGFTLMQGEQQAGLLESQARIEKAYGKMKRKQSIWDAIATGLQGYGSMAYMGYQAGLFSPSAGGVLPSPAANLAKTSIFTGSSGGYRSVGTSYLGFGR